MIYQKLQKMILNEKKPKLMIFSFTERYKFTTNSEVLEQAKLLCVIKRDDLSWDKITFHGMDLIRKM